MIQKNSLTMINFNQNYLDKSIRLAKYYLQYAAINSQFKNHLGAFN